MNLPSTAALPVAPSPAGLVVYGAFDSPWSYLASRRCAFLAEDGVQIDWRAVEDEAGRREELSDRADRFERVRQELDQSVAVLLPAERLPYALAGFVTTTAAAVVAYAEACRLGAGPLVRRHFFEAFWLHAFDLDDQQSVQTLLADRLPADLPMPWRGRACGSGRRLSDQWAAEWRDLGSLSFPLVVDGGETRHGFDAVEWLGEHLATRGVDLDVARSWRMPESNAS